MARKGSDEWRRKQIEKIAKKEHKRLRKLEGRKGLLGRLVDKLKKRRS